VRFCVRVYGINNLSTFLKTKDTENPRNCKLFHPFARPVEGFGSGLVRRLVKFLTSNQDAVPFEILDMSKPLTMRLKRTQPRTSPAHQYSLLEAAGVMYGIVLPQHIGQLRRDLPNVLEDESNELTTFSRVR
jgi:hypothetical protein